MESEIIGSVSLLCASAADTARALGYEPLLLTDRLDCEAREAGAFLAAMRENAHGDADGARSYWAARRWCMCAAGASAGAIRSWRWRRRAV